MSEIAFIQPTAPQTPPPGPPPAESDTQGFAPHLDKAIAGRQDQPSSRESSSKQSENKSSDNTSARNGNEIPGNVRNGATQRQTLANSEATIEKTAEADTATTDQSLASANDLTPAIVMAQIAAKDQTDTSALSRNLTANAQLFDFLSKFSNNYKAETGEQIPASQKSVATPSESNFSKTALAETMVLPTAETALSPAVVKAPESQSTNDALLLEIQKIISESGGSGRASITATGNNLKTRSEWNGLQTTISEGAALPTTISEGAALPLTITSNEFASSDIDASVALLPTGSEVPAEKANQDITSMRHSIRQQYYEGKFLPQQEPENQTSSENNQPNNTFSPEAGTTGETHTISTTILEQTSTFSQSLSLLQTGQKQTTIETLHPVTLPSGTLIQQEEVIRQITEHLQISRRDSDTRVNIKLHPEELGELKINLFVKEGAIRANVVASTQYAQEIIEKNVTKLRTILENQGFTISEISVTSKSDTAGDFNLFDRQLFSQNDYTPPSTKNFRTREATFTLENTSTPEHETVTGVNVKI